MSFADLEDMKEFAELLDDQVRDKFPDHADEARAYINTILRRDDHGKYLAYNALSYDPEIDLSMMGSAHLLVSALLSRRDEGIDVPEWYMESTVRIGLRLGFAVIESDKPE